MSALPSPVGTSTGTRTGGQRTEKETTIGRDRGIVRRNRYGSKKEKTHGDTETGGEENYEIAKKLHRLRGISYRSAFVYSPRSDIVR